MEKRLMSPAGILRTFSFAEVYQSDSLCHNHDLDSLIVAAHRQGASDLHLEPGLPAALRVRGALRTVANLWLATHCLSSRGGHRRGIWPHFVERRSADFSRTIGGVRCRFNVMQHVARSWLRRPAARDLSGHD